MNSNNRSSIHTLQRIEGTSVRVAEGIVVSRARPSSSPGNEDEVYLNELMPSVYDTIGITHRTCGAGSIAAAVHAMMAMVTSLTCDEHAKMSGEEQFAMQTVHVPYARMTPADRRRVRSAWALSGRNEPIGEDRVFKTFGQPCLEIESPRPHQLKEPAPTAIGKERSANEHQRWRAPPMGMGM